MGQYVLIDKERLRFVKAAPSFMQAEYWSAILCKNRDTYLCGPQKRYFAHFSEMELRMLWANAHGGQECPAKQYEDLVACVAALSERLPLDDTSEEALAKNLGRTISCTEKGANNQSVSSKRNDTGVTIAVTSASSEDTPMEAKKANRVEKHGVVRPREGGKCAAVWDICDKLGKSKATAAEVLAVGTKKGLLESNIRCEYQRWKKFNGISGRVEG